eukprot:gene6176-4454_t
MNPFSSGGVPSRCACGPGQHHPSANSIFLGRERSLSLDIYIYMIIIIDVVVVSILSCTLSHAVSFRLIELGIGTIHLGLFVSLTTTSLSEFQCSLPFSFSFPYLFFSMIHNCNSPVRPRAGKSYRNHPYSFVLTSTDDSNSDFRNDMGSSNDSKNSYDSASCTTYPVAHGEAPLDFSPVPPAFSVAGIPKAMALPAAAAPASVTFAANTPLVLGFKYGVKVVTASFPTETGIVLVVEGDRGYDCGTVLHAAAPCSRSRFPVALRVANNRDLEDMEQRKEMERKALVRLQELAAQTDFTAKVVDIMFQLDRKKITIIVERESKVFVDFRRLQRAAFDFYRCRVWFSYLDEEEQQRNRQQEIIRLHFHSKESSLSQEGFLFLLGEAFEVMLHLNTLSPPVLRHDVPLFLFCVVFAIIFFSPLFILFFFFFFYPPLPHVSLLLFVVCHQLFAFIFPPKTSYGTSEHMFQLKKKKWITKFHHDTFSFLFFFLLVLVLMRLFVQVAPSFLLSKLVLITFRLARCSRYFTTHPFFSVVGLVFFSFDSFVVLWMSVSCILRPCLSDIPQDLVFAIMVFSIVHVYALIYELTPMNAIIYPIELSNISLLFSFCCRTDDLTVVFRVFGITL